jgi:hypothetical protein
VPRWRRKEGRFEYTNEGNNKSEQRNTNKKQKIEEPLELRKSGQ